MVNKINMIKRLGGEAKFTQPESLTRASSFSARQSVNANRKFINNYNRSDLNARQSSQIANSSRQNSLELNSSYQSSRTPLSPNSSRQNSRTSTFSARNSSRQDSSASASFTPSTPLHQNPSSPTPSRTRPNFTPSWLKKH